MWGLPALSIAFTWWMPAAVQVTFFVSGLLSFGQASLFRQEWFRKYFNMTPVPKPTPAGQAPASPYKGNLNIKANPVLSQAELSQRFQGVKGTTNLQEKVSKIRESSPPGGAFGKAITGTFKEIKEAGSGVAASARDSMDGRRQKADVLEKKQYEAKKQEQLKKERWEKENERRAERAAKKMYGKR
jgi:YidC/Oxa1 family membrane protein insertase